MFGIKVLEERKSEYNGDIKVVRSLGYGTYIQVEGLTQSGGIVESIWKSTLKRIAYSQKRIVKNCLILGLGGGSAAKLVRKYWPDCKITGVDIDPVMAELGKKYLGLGQIRMEIEICDALTYPLSTVRCDLVIVDLYCGDEFPKKFESKRFRSLVHGLLTDSGVAVFNRLYYGEKRKEAVKFGNKLEKIFKNVEWFYPQANLMLLCYNK